MYKLKSPYPVSFQVLLSENAQMLRWPPSMLPRPMSVPVTGHLAGATQLLAATILLRDTLNTPFTQADRPYIEEQIQSCRAALGEEAFQRAWSVGEAMSLEEAVALAQEPVE